MSRLDGLCIGSLIAIWRVSSYGYAKNRLARLALVLLGTHLIFLLLAKTMLPSFPHFQFFGYSSIALIFGIIVFMTVEKRSKISSLFLENRTLRYIGKISYSLYVFHWPVLMLTKMYFLDSLVRNGVSVNTGLVLLSIIAFIIALSLSIISYRFFEVKIQSLKDMVTSEGYFLRVRKKLTVMLAFGLTK
jgi:peptidoglycan/LPS O-acetylase OafA/YrhL